MPPVPATQGNLPIYHSCRVVWFNPPLVVLLEQEACCFEEVQGTLT